MHFLFLTAAVIGFVVIALLLFAGAWVWSVVIRNAVRSARANAALTTPHAANVTLPESQLVVVAGNLVARNQVN